MQRTGARFGDESTLVLGFDAGCITCSELAKRIEERVGDKVEVRSLSDPVMDHWRKEALGEDAPWVPTLVEIEGGKVQAWTGIRMGVRLGRALGPLATWRVMQVLGDVHGTTTPVESPVDTVAFGMSRKHFLKGLGGSAVALGVLTGTGNFVSMAFARSASRDEALEALKSVKRTDLTGKELVDVARGTAQHKDIVNVMGRAWSVEMRHGRVTATSKDSEKTIQMRGVAPSQTTDQKTPKASRITVKATRHELRNGAIMLAVAYKLPQDGKVLLHYDMDVPIPNGIDEFKSQALLYRAVRDEAVLERLSIDGKGEVHQEAEGRSARRRCGTCGPGDCLRTVRVCTNIKYGCVAVACAACIPACRSILGCLFCAGVACPYAYNFGCCRSRGTRCVGCNYC